VKKREKVSKRTDALFKDKKKGVGKPTDNENLELIRSKYDNPLATNDVYNVPQRFAHVPMQAREANMIAPCTNPATYTDVSSFPDQFGTAEEAVATYNQMGAKMRTQFKLAGMSRNEHGEMTVFRIVC